jgi:predicted ATPase
MKIDYLKINSRFKNLDQVTINFDEQELMTVVVGLNGSGKSNVLEALVAIFRDLDLGEAPRFAYEIMYKLGEGKSEKWVIVNADPTGGSTPSKQYRIQYNENSEKNLLGEETWKTVPLSKVTRDKKSGQSAYLPRHLFAYYSGPSDRLEKYFKKHRTDFYRRLLRNELSLEGEIRPLFYAKPIHSQYVLLAFFLGNSDSQELRFLREHLGIEGLDSIHFVLRRPDWTRPDKRNELFWGASGVVRKFLDRVFPYSLAPLKITRNEDVSLTGKNIENEFFHLFIPDLDALHAIAGSLTPDVFFKMLESTVLSEVVADVHVRVKVRNVDRALSFRELSEGEQQLLTVLGLLKFTGEKDTLFLLDEPDTHLNPAWDIKYLRFLRDFVPNQNTSHLIMITHNPLAIAELKKEQVQIMWRDSSAKVFADEPGEDPQGMGFEGILMSDMFGLKSPVDPATQALLEEKLDLLAKENLTLNQKERLTEIDSKLESYGMNYSSRDPLYSLFLKKVSKQARHVYKPKEVVLTNAQRQELDDITDKIIEEIKTDVNKGQANDPS